MIKEDIKRFLKDTFHLDDTFELMDNTSFLETGIIDSMGILELVSFIQSRFKIRIEDEELIPENLDSLGNICQFLERKNVAQ